MHFFPLGELLEHRSLIRKLGIVALFHVNSSDSDLDCYWSCGYVFPITSVTFLIFKKENHKDKKKCLVHNHRYYFLQSFYYSHESFLEKEFWDFPGGLAFKDSVLPLLSLGWQQAQELLHAKPTAKKKKKKNCRSATFYLCSTRQVTLSHWLSISSALKGYKVNMLTWRNEIKYINRVRAAHDVYPVKGN